MNQMHGIVVGKHALILETILFVAKGDRSACWAIPMLRRHLNPKPAEHFFLFEVTDNIDKVRDGRSAPYLSTGV